MSVILNNYKIMLCPRCCSIVAFDIDSDIITYSGRRYNWETSEEVQVTKEWAECPSCKETVVISTETKSKSREEFLALRNIKGGN